MITLDDEPTWPKELRRAVAGCHVTSKAATRLGGRLYEVRKDAAVVAYLKEASNAGEENLEDEYIRLHWIRKYVAVAEPLYFGVQSDRAFLLTATLPGQPAHLLRDAAFSWLPHAIASTMRALHSIPVESCPFSPSFGLELAALKVRRGSAQFDASVYERVTGVSPDVAIEQIAMAEPAPEHLVVTHGDFFLPNLIVESRSRVALLDVGQAGVGDSYRDIVCMAQSFSMNFGPGADAAFLKAIGVTGLDVPRVRTRALIDAFF